MNPGIFYLYEYSNNKKLRNVGFLKIELHYHNCQLQIHARGIPVKKGDSIALFAFFVQNSVPVSYKITEINCANNCMMGKLAFSESDFPESRKLSGMAGFFLRTSGNRFYVAAPPEVEFNTEQITAWEKPVVLAGEPEDDMTAAEENKEEKEKKEELQPELDMQAETEIQQPIAQPLQEALQTQEEPQEQKASLTQTAAQTQSAQAIPQTQDTPHPQDTPRPQTSAPQQQTAPEPQQTGRQPDSQSQSQSSPAAAQTQEVQEALREQETDKSSNVTARKIQRSDLTILPRRCWSIANNSFLMHGYHNYHHLLLVEEEGHFWLGVPGIYAPREAKAAELFGFGQFTKSYVPHLELTAEERDKSEDFGHWCRYIR